MKNLINDFPNNILNFPLLFAQVREDSLLDIQLIKSHFPEGKIDVAMIASGGCTAAALTSNSAINSLALVDANPSQLALTKLKLHLLQFPLKKRLEILGHKSIDAKLRQSMIEGIMHALDIPLEIFGEIIFVSEHGLDFVGRYERLFDEFRSQLQPYQGLIEDLFHLEIIEEQTKLIKKGSLLGDAIDATFQKVFSQDNLTMIFGQEATANRIQSFADHFVERIRKYLSNHLAKDSPYFAQLFLGRFYNENFYPWLNIENAYLPDNISFHHMHMNEFLANADKESYDLIHLSNILDWLKPEEAEKMLENTYKALKPGGAVIIRQLNSCLDFKSYNNALRWEAKTSEEYHQEDRSFFYRELHVGFKPHVSMAPQITKIADQVLLDSKIFEGTFFQSIYSKAMDLDFFRRTQIDFFYAVDYFSKPMIVLASKLDLHHQRIDILHNIVEEHGDFDSNLYHSETFRVFLRSLGVNTSETFKIKKINPAVDAFNAALVGTAYAKDPLVGIACIGIIEYAFAEISAIIGNYVIDCKWVKKNELVHYGVHAELDKTHAEDFFKLLEPFIHDSEKMDLIYSGLKLGAHIFNELYQQLYFTNINNLSFGFLSSN